MRKYAFLQLAMSNCLLADIWGHGEFCRICGHKVSFLGYRSESVLLLESQPLDSERTPWSIRKPQSDYIALANFGRLMLFGLHCEVLVNHSVLGC